MSASSSSSGSPCQPLTRIDSFSEATGPRYRKIALNGMPKPDHKPQSKPETDEEREETYVDALLLSLRHDTSDIYIPVVGDSLPFAIKRTVASELFTTNPCMPPELDPNRPFGHAWTSGITANVQFTWKSPQPFSSCPASRTEPDYTFVTDETGTVFRFTNLNNDYFPAFMPIPTNFSEQENFLASLIVLNPADAQEDWEFQFTKKYGTSLVFSPQIFTRAYQTNPDSGSAPLFQFYGYSRLLSVTDRYGNVIAYNGDGTSLIPTSIELSDGREIIISRSTDGLRVTQIQDPLGNIIRYNYQTITIGIPSSIIQLTSVERPEGQTIFYTYSWNMIRDNTPRTLPLPPPGIWYFFPYNLASITDSNGNIHEFTYQADKSFQQYDSLGGWYYPTGVANIIASVTLPNGLISTFVPSMDSPIQVVYISDLSTLNGFRSVAVTDTEGNLRTYIFDTGQLTDSSAFEILLVPAYPPGSVETSFYFLIRWQRMQLVNPTGVTETFMFNLEAAMALDSVTDYSGNTSYYDYLDEWSAASLFPWMDPSLVENPIFYGNYSDPTSQTDNLGNTKYFEYQDLSANISLNGNTVSGVASITALPTTTGLEIGMAISGVGIPARTTIAAIVSSSSVTLTAAATASDSGTTFVFSSPTILQVMTQITDELGRVTSYELNPVNGLRTSEIITSPEGAVVKTTLFEYTDSVYAAFMTKKTVVGGTTGGDLITTYISDSYGYAAQESTGGISLTGNTTNGSSTISGLSSTSGLAVGMSVIGKGIPSGATVATIASSTSITLSASATAPGTGVPLAFTYPSTVTKTGTTTSGSLTVSSLGSTTGLLVGMNVSGPGIPSGATVSTIVSSSSITLSIAATAAGSVSLVFAYPVVCSTTKYVHDVNGNRTQVTDPNNNVTHFAYDGLNRLIKVTNPDSTVREISYDPAGNKIAETDENVHLTLYTYDKLNRLTQKRRVMGSTLIQTGNTATGSLTISGLLTTSGIAVGMSVTGRGIPAGATVSSIVSSTSVAISTPVRTTTTGNTASGSEFVLGLPISPVKLGLEIGMKVHGVGFNFFNLIDVASILPPTLVMNGVTTSGSTTITGLTSTAGLAVGMGVSGLLIPLGATVTAILSSTSITISAAAVSSSSGDSLTFTSSGIKTSMNAIATETGTTLSFSYPVLSFTGTVLTFGTLSSSADLITAYTYNGVNSKISETDPNGNTTTYAYDSIQRLIQITDALSQIWLHDFSGPNTGASAFASSDFKPTQITDPRGFRTWFVYDALYRTISKNVEYEVIE